MPSTDGLVDREKAAPGASWQGREEQVLPKNRLGIVFFGLMCTTFLAALDQVRPKAVGSVGALTTPLSTDNRCDRTPDDSGRTWRWKQLWLGWKVCSCRV